MMEAKKGGVTDVLLDLAYCYEMGIEVNRRNPTEAFSLTKEAVESGVMWSSLELASYYENGIGVEENWKEGAGIYREIFERDGIEAKSARACYAMCLIRGRGVEKNVAKGFKLLQQSC